MLFSKVQVVVKHLYFDIASTSKLVQIYRLLYPPFPVTRMQDMGPQLSRQVAAPVFEPSYGLAAGARLM